MHVTTPHTQPTSHTAPEEASPSQVAAGPWKRFVEHASEKENAWAQNASSEPPCPQPAIQRHQSTQSNHHDHSACLLARTPASCSTALVTRTLERTCCPHHPPTTKTRARARVQNQECRRARKPLPPRALATDALPPHHLLLTHPPARQ